MSEKYTDVLIIGAGLSGIGAAYRLQERAPGWDFTILESRSRIGGTWDLFRYPGIRSDSDMYTLSYPFRPWDGPDAIAQGEDIRAYVESTAHENRIDDHILFERRVTDAAWDSDAGVWSVTAIQPDGSAEAFTARFLYLCCGYYSYDQAHSPAFPGSENFEGEIVHPQFWPEDLEVEGRRVVVIGSGATAITLVPALARRGAQVTMLQRSPTYLLSQPRRSAWVRRARSLLPTAAVHRLARFAYATKDTLVHGFCAKFPKLSERLLINGVHRQVPAEDLRHFTPRYKPWDQRTCVVPDRDLWKALDNGSARMVTDHIDSFSRTGIELASGEHLDADVIATATGLKLNAMGDISLTVDGAHIDPHELQTYQGVMFSGIPNLAWCLGYTFSAWTLGADIAWRFVADFLNHLQLNHYSYGMPDPAGPQHASSSVFDLKAGYIQRAQDLLPQQGSKRPWMITQNWFQDSWAAAHTDLDDDLIWR